MTTRFRNVDFDRSAPLDRWPAEPIEAIIDRGSLSDWRELADAIRRNPSASAARTTETVIGWGGHYGVDALMDNVIRHAREDVTRRGRDAYAQQIRAWRAQTGMTLREFARAAGTSASRLSDYEHAKVAPTTDVLGRLAHVAASHTPPEARSAVAALRTTRRSDHRIDVRALVGGLAADDLGAT